MLKTVIVPLDGSAYAERALEPAAVLSRQAEAKVVLITCPLITGLARPDHYLVEARARMEATDVETLVIPDRGPRAGLEVAANDLPEPVICMTTHGSSGFCTTLLGSVAEDVVREIRVPFLLVGPRVRPEPALTFRRVLACTDGSAASQAILPVVSDWIEHLELQPWLVQVIEPGPHVGDHPSDDRDVLEEALVRGLAKDLSVDEGDVNWDVLHSANPARAIVDYAARLPASLIAMSTHGRSGLERLVVGSVTAGVVHRAHCPVLVVRPDGLRSERMLEMEDR